MFFIFKKCIVISQRCKPAILQKLSIGNHLLHFSEQSLFTVHDTSWWRVQFGQCCNQISNMTVSVDKTRQHSFSLQIN